MKILITTIHHPLVGFLNSNDANQPSSISPLSNGMNPVVEKWEPTTSPTEVFSDALLKQRCDIYILPSSFNTSSLNLRHPRSNFQRRTKVVNYLSFWSLEPWNHGNFLPNWLVSAAINFKEKLGSRLLFPWSVRTPIAGQDRRRRRGRAAKGGAPTRLVHEQPSQCKNRWIWLLIFLPNIYVKVLNRNY